MSRNAERDAILARRRKQQMVKAGFKLFSQNGIENVSLQAVADAAQVGIATLYNYYQNKTNLVVAISTAIWTDVWKKALKVHPQEALLKCTAYELIEIYADTIISLYQKRPEVLRFSSDYKTFVCRQAATDEQLQMQLTSLEPISQLFHVKYEQAKSDGSIRTDIPEAELFATTSLTMLSVAERYAQGIVWAKYRSEDHTKELEHLKEMMLDWVRPNGQ